MTAAISKKDLDMQIKILKADRNRQIPVAVKALEGLRRAEEKYHFEFQSIGIDEEFEKLRKDTPTESIVEQFVGLEYSVHVRQGDTVIVESISRFARNTRDLLELVERLTTKGVEFVSKKEAIDTTTPTGKFMLTVFGAVAELEREYILQRQQEGIAIAKEQGKYKGRKPIDHPDFQKVVVAWNRGELTATQAMWKLDMSKATFYRKVKGISR